MKSVPIPVKKTIKKSSTVYKGRSVTTGSLKKGSALATVRKSTKKYGKRMIRSVLLSRSFHFAFKMGIVMLLVGSALYGAYAFIGNTISDEVVVSKSEIVARVLKHTTLPPGLPEAVVRVQDPATLKQQNPFYENVKEGDYILMYPTVAVIYDLRNDTIVALKSTDR